MMEAAKRKKPSGDGENGAAGAGSGAGAGAQQGAAKRARVALVKVDSSSGAIVKRADVRTSNLTAPIMLLTGHKVSTFVLGLLCRSPLTPCWSALPGCCALRQV